MVSVVTVAVAATGGCSNCSCCAAGFIAVLSFAVPATGG